MHALLDSNMARFARARPGMLFGLLVIVCNLALAAIGPLIAPFPTEAPSGDSLLPPGALHWFGS